MLSRDTRKLILSDDYVYLNCGDLAVCMAIVRVSIWHDTGGETALSECPCGVIGVGGPQREEDAVDAALFGPRAILPSAVSERMWPEFPFELAYYSASFGEHTNLNGVTGLTTMTENGRYAVCIAAVDGAMGDWAAYIKAFEGHLYDLTAEYVVEQTAERGVKLYKDEGLAFFPNLEGLYRR